MAVVVFDPAAFKIIYPEFAAVPDPRLQNFFDQATIYLNNTDNSIVQNITFRTVLLNMLTAHIGALSGVLSASGQGQAVGRIKMAQEGSVQGEFQFDAPYSAQWFIQTQYGAAFWQATVSLRSFTYVPRQTGYFGGNWFCPL